jgi:hypothetical protein
MDQLSAMNVSPPRGSRHRAQVVGRPSSQLRFEAFMADQIAAIEASGMAPEVWIQRNAVAFRTGWEARHSA